MIFMELNDISFHEEEKKDQHVVIAKIELEI